MEKTKTVAWIAIGILVLVAYLAYNQYSKNNPTVVK